VRTGQRNRARLILPAALLVLVALAVMLPGAAAGLVWLAPALVLFMTLSLGCYPGETLLRAAALKRSRRRPAPVVARPSRSPVYALRCGRPLLAYRLAGRAPPSDVRFQRRYLAV
jgi:hypothetical protein